MKVNALNFFNIERFDTRHKLCERTQIQPPMAVGSCILTWRGSISDQWGVSPKTRPFHCTLTWLTLAITANVGNSTVQFLVVGVCVRAHPLPNTMKYFQKCMCTCTHMCMHRTYMCLHVRMLVVYICIHMYIYMCPCKNVCMHVYESMYSCIWKYYACTFVVDVCRDMHAYDCMYMNACMDGHLFLSLMGRTRL